MLQTADKVRSVGVAGEESTGSRSGRRIDVDEDGMFGRFDDRVGVLPQSVSVREERSVPVESILRHVENHLSRAAVRRHWLQSGDEVFLHPSDSNDSSRFFPNSKIDEGDVLVEEVDGGVESRFSERSRRSEEGRKGSFGGARWRFERDTVNELGGDVQCVFFLVVCEDAARCEG